MTGHPADPAAELAALRTHQARDGSLAVPARRELLRRLEAAVLAEKETIVRAADADFGGRAREETLFGEVLGVVAMLRYAVRHLERWARPRRVPVGLPFWPARARIVPRPLGVVGVMSPWNYPLLLALGPLIGALGAGNRVMLKPSEHAPRMADELERLLDVSLGPEVVRTVQGGPETARAFAGLPLDHLVFTGSTARGREVALAAAANLVPVTLELGGKCPAIVLPDADLEQAAEAIVLGKGLNAGQTCVAPDHVLLAGLPAERFLPLLDRAMAERFPGGLPTGLVPHARDRLAMLRTGQRPITLVLDPPEDSPLAREEIFGPILPIHSLPDLEAVVARLHRQAAPLATYLFGRDRTAERRLLAEVAAGALVVGGTVLHAAMPALPFGGVGSSGMGRYHGEAGFDRFSNLKAHVHAPRFSLAQLGQPPYGRAAARLLAQLLPDRPR